MTMVGKYQLEVGNKDNNAKDNNIIIYKLASQR